MRVYAIVRSKRTKTGISETVERSGLPHKEARAEADRLQEEERKSKPGKTSWIYDIFSIRYEGDQ